MLSKLQTQGISIRVASPKLVMEEVSCWCGVIFWRRRLGGSLWCAGSHSQSFYFRVILPALSLFQGPVLGGFMCCSPLLPCHDIFIFVTFSQRCLYSKDPCWGGVFVCWFSFLFALSSHFCVQVTLPGCSLFQGTVREVVPLGPHSFFSLEISQF